MKKHLLNLGLCLLATTFGFAQNRQITVTASSAQVNVAKAFAGADATQARPTTTLASCALINNPLPSGWTGAEWTAGTDGFINGTNNYFDVEKAMFFNLSSLSFTTLNQIDVDFGRAYSATPSKVIGVRIYDGTSNSPIGATQITSQGITMGTVMANVAANTLTSFYFPAGVALPASKKIFISIDIAALDYTIGDTLSITSTNNNQSVNTAWERWSDGTWHDYPTAYTNPVPLNLSLFIFPYLSNGPIVSNFTASANPICQGSSITYNYGSSTVAGGYYWNAYTSATASYTTNTVTSPVVTYPTAGTFTTTLSNANLCGAINASQITVTVNPRPTVTASPSSTTVCSGTSIVLNGGGANTYAWTGGISNGVSFTPSTSQNYTVTGTAANGCTNTAVSSVVVNATGPAVTASTTANNFCQGQSITLTGSGATTYTWTGGVTNGVAFTPSATQTYTVIGGTGTCTNSAVITINVNPKPTVTANATSTSVCSGSPVTLSGSGSATSYAWTGGISNGVAFSPTSSQTYTVTGTLGSCTNTAAVTVNITSGPTVGANTTANTICQGQSVTLTGSGATSYAWTGGITNGVAFAPTSTQTYTVTGTSGSCSNTAVVTVSVNAAPVVSSNPVSAVICSGANVTFSGGGANTYVWTGGISNGVAFSPSTSGTYTVTGTATNGCTGTAVANVTVNATPIVTANTTTNTICPGSQVTLTGGGATSYLWTDGVVNGTPFSPTVTKTYTVTGASGPCTNTAVVTVVVNPTPNVTASPASATSCNGSNVTLNGGGAASYVWTGGVANNVPFSPSSTNTYTVTGTAANGCTATAVATITVVSSLNVTASTTSNAVCQGQNVTLNGGGATSYAWTGGVTNGVAFAPSSTQTYTVTGTAGSCSNTAVVSVTVNALPNVTATASPTNVCAGNNVTLSGLGATSYVWTGGATNNIPFAPTASGVYTVTGTSAGCSNSAVVTVVVTNPPTVSAAASATVICVGNSVTLTGFGATTYTYTGGVTNNVPFTPAATAVYFVSGTANGCVGTNSVQIVVNQCVGIESFTSANAGVMVYPNPNNGDFMIKGSKQMTITIANELGQVVETVELSLENNFSYNVSQLARGVYFLNGNAVREKVIVTK